MTEHRAQGAFAVLMLVAAGLSFFVYPLVHGEGRVIVPGRVLCPGVHRGRHPAGWSQAWQDNSRPVVTTPARDGVAGW